VNAACNECAVPRLIRAIGRHFVLLIAFVLDVSQSEPPERQSLPKIAATGTDE
jgi:hypothetical protein